eukprot:1146793-Pelagomonas_calceolata.AAC.11
MPLVLEGKTPSCKPPQMGLHCPICCKTPSDKSRGTILSSKPPKMGPYCPGLVPNPVIAAHHRLSVWVSDWCPTLSMFGHALASPC